MMAGTTPSPLLNAFNVCYISLITGVNPERSPQCVKRIGLSARMKSDMTGLRDLVVEELEED